MGLAARPMWAASQNQNEDPLFKMDPWAQGAQGRQKTSDGWAQASNGKGKGSGSKIAQQNGAEKAWKQDSGRQKDPIYENDPWAKGQKGPASTANSATWMRPSPPCFPHNQALQWRMLNKVDVLRRCCKNMGYTL
eukprot:Skav213886  [mRNA]  locus=scaffold245:14662:17086:- [translate_table: standard]